MRIAMIGQKGIPAAWGGVERHVEELANVLAKRGHEILVYSRSWYTRHAPYRTQKGVVTIHTPTLHTKHLDAIIHTFTATVHAIFVKADVIHYHGVGPSLLSFIPRIFSPRTRVVTTFHCIDRYHQKWGAIARFVLRLGEKAACTFAHETIAVSKAIQQYCLNEYHTMVSYIPSGVPIPHQHIAHPLHPGVSPQKYILMVARLVPHKGAHYLIEAWRQARRFDPALISGYKLAIVGDSTFTNKYVTKLKASADDDGDVLFLGWQNSQQLDTLYNNATLVVHPSENEGLSLAVLEAMAHAKATLVSDIAEHEELITDERALFARANPVDLARKLIYLLKHPLVRDELGTRNRHVVERGYNWKTIGESVEGVYEKLEQKISPLPATVEI